MQKKRFVAQLSMLSVLTMALIACGGGNGSISGTVSPGATKPSSAESFVAGEVIVKFRSKIQATSAVTLQAGGLQLARVRNLGLARTSLYRSQANHAKTLELVKQLSSRSDVEYAEVNGINYAMAVPTDPQYVRQWHYENMNLPAAWDISTGVASTVVAVIDDGMLYNLTDTDPKTHPDFAGKVIGGYDMISDPNGAGDGDGRDANPYDNLIGLHGTHVGGTIAAATNNDKFGAGVNWNAKLINVRVLGNGGGTVADIADGVLWAAGETVDGLPVNPNPAKVLNLSLGGDGACSATYQTAFDTVTAKGVIAVVAAGNETANTADKNPANCNNVITVGATGPTNKRAGYSNFGARIDVMAPGGDLELSVNRGGEDFQAGVFSTYADKANGNAFNLGSIQGTSMATPHMAGLVSLMVGIDPTLNYTKTLAFLKNNATALAAGDCSNGNATVTDAFCGSGLVNAAKTLKAVKDALGGPVTPPPPAPPAPPAVKTTKNFVRAVDSSDASKVKQVEINLTKTAVAYSLTDLAPGTYKVTAYDDLNGNAAPDANEPKVSLDITIGAGENKANINLTMQPDS